MVKGGKKRKEKKNTEEGRLESLWWEPMSCSCSCDSKGQRDVGKRSKRSREEWPNRVIASVPLWPFVPRWFHIYLFTFLSLLYLCLLALFFLCVRISEGKICRRFRVTVWWDAWTASSFVSKQQQQQQVVADRISSGDCLRAWRPL